MKQRIRTGTFAFHDEYWKDVSNPAKEVDEPHNLCQPLSVLVYIVSQYPNVTVVNSVYSQSCQPSQTHGAS
jgi:hypothetical protein